VNDLREELSCVGKEKFYNINMPLKKLWTILNMKTREIQRPIKQFFLYLSGICTHFYSIFKLYNEKDWWAVLLTSYEVDRADAADRITGSRNNWNYHTNVCTATKVSTLPMAMLYGKLTIQ
jgi:hypothetical protein